MKSYQRCRILHPVCFQYLTGQRIKAVRFQKGLTLVELMTTIMIAALLITLGVPSFQNTIKNNRLSTEVNRFVSHIQLARSEAIKRNQVVIICRSNGAAACKTGAGSDYDKGWILYADASGKGDDDYEAAKGDDLIQLAGSVNANIQIRGNHRWLSYSNTGMLKEGSTAEYRFCNEGVSTETVPGRRLFIDFSGQPRLSKLAAGASCSV